MKQAKLHGQFYKILYNVISGYCLVVTVQLLLVIDFSKHKTHCANIGFNSKRILIIICDEEFFNFIKR